MMDFRGKRSTLRMWALGAGSAVVWACGLSARAAPLVFWASEPVQPDDTVILLGDALGPAATVEISRLPDVKTTGPGGPEDPVGHAGDWQAVTPLVSSEQSLHVVVPATWKQGAFVLRVRTPQGLSEPVLVNDPHIRWTQGNQGNGSATPGGWLRIFGTSLNLGRQSRVLLERASGDRRTLIPETDPDPNPWALRLRLPEDLPVGDYRIWVHNGYGGTPAWGGGQSVRVLTANLGKTDVFGIGETNGEGNSPTQAIQAALDKAGENGGGVVVIPRGNYRLDDTLTIPRHVTLRGEAQRLVSLLWEDGEVPREALIRGTDHFTVADLTLYAWNHLHGIAAARGHREGSGHVTIRRVRMRLDRYILGRRFKDPMAEMERRGRIEGRAAAIQVGGDNVQITDCDIFITPTFKHGSILGLILDRVRGGHFARIKINGPYRATLMTKGGDGIIIEESDIAAFGFVGTHHTPGDELGGGGSLLNPCFQNFFLSRNVIHDNNWWDRELLALDSHGPAGTYEGRLEKAEGTDLVLAGDPRHPADRWDRWVGAGLYVLDGKGAGQYRRIVAGNGRNVVLDRTWDVTPDATSRISVAKYHGGLYIIGNHFRDGGNVMLWGGGIDSVVARNTLERIGVVLSISSYIYSGLMPEFCNQFVGNRIIEGNGSFGGNVGIGHATYPSDRFFGVYDGFLGRGLVSRRNVVENNGRIYVSGAVRDAVVEHNVITDSAEGVSITARKDARPKWVLVRKNRTERVTTPLAGDALDGARIMP